MAIAVWAGRMTRVHQQRGSSPLFFAPIAQLAELLVIINQRDEGSSPSRGITIY